MYETTPECPKAADAGQYDSSAETSLSVPLFASRRLRRLMAATLLAFATLPAITLLPHIVAQPGWLLVLLCFWVLVALGGWELRAWAQGYPSGLSLQGGELRLEFASKGIGSAYPVERVGESLVWSWLLVVPLRFSSTGQRYILVCLPDSAERDALRRLRVWLKTRNP